MIKKQTFSKIKKQLKRRKIKKSMTEEFKENLNSLKKTAKK